MENIIFNVHKIHRKQTKKRVQNYLIYLNRY